MQLWLLRHAATEDRAPSGRDQDRRLTPDGRAQCHDLHAWISTSSMALPDRIYVSPAFRAQETARAVLGHLDMPSPSTEPRLWNATVGDLVSFVDEQSDARRLMLIAHNPGLEGLVRWLGGQLPVQGMKPCTLCVLDTAFPLTPGGSRSLAVYRPSESV
ncbi:MAG: histidine phosphatase family protein [Wenzhouxiangella sp.]|nr:histidine phosphatase family protein [Wenzhouxiangella sp.]